MGAPSADVDAAIVPAEVVGEALDTRREDRVALGRHIELCSVCQHPDVADIETLYTGWLDPAKVARAYKLDLVALQTHAARFGWQQERAANVDLVLAKLIENSLHKLAPQETVTLDELLGMIQRLQQGRMHLGGAPRKVERALRTGRQPAPVEHGGKVRTWEHMVRETRTRAIEATSEGDGGEG